jgi:hypothetical protein
MLTPGYGAFASTPQTRSTVISCAPSKVNCIRASFLSSLAYDVLHSRAERWQIDWLAEKRNQRQALQHRWARRFDANRCYSFAKRRGRRVTTCIACETLTSSHAHTPPTEAARNSALGQRQEPPASMTWRSGGRRPVCASRHCFDRWQAIPLNPTARSRSACRAALSSGRCADRFERRSW